MAFVRGALGCTPTFAVGCFSDRCKSGAILHAFRADSEEAIKGLASLKNTDENEKNVLSFCTPKS